MRLCSVAFIKINLDIFYLYSCRAKLSLLQNNTHYHSLEWCPIYNMCNMAVLIP